MKRLEATLGVIICGAFLFSGCDIIKQLVFGTKQEPPQQEALATPVPTEPVAKPTDEIPFPDEENPFDSAPTKDEAVLTPVDTPSPTPLSTPEPKKTKKVKKHKTKGKLKTKSKPSKKNARKTADGIDDFYQVQSRAPRAGGTASRSKAKQSTAAPMAAQKPAEPEVTKTEQETLDEALAPETDTNMPPSAPVVENPSPTPSEPKPSTDAEDDLFRVDEPLPSVTPAESGAESEQPATDQAVTPNTIIMADTISNSEKKAVISIEGQSVLNYNFFKSQDMKRITVDFPKTALASTVRNPVPTKINGIVKSITFSTGDPIRLTIFLERPADCEPIVDGNKLDLSIVGKGKAESAYMSADEIEMPGNVLTDIRAEKDTGGTSLVIEAKESFGYKIFKKQNPFRIQIDLLNTGKSESLGNQIKLSEAPFENATIEQLSEEGKPMTRIIITLNQYPAIMESLQENRLILTLKE